MNIKQHLKPYILNNCLECTLIEFFLDFEIEFNYDYNKKLYPNYTQRVAEYLKGLPSNINIPFEYYEIEKLVKSFDTKVTDRTLKRYKNYFFEIVADILVKEYVK